MPAGSRLYGHDAPRIVKRGRRTTPLGGITTVELPLLRIDDIPVFADRAYMIKTSNMNLDGSLANDIGAVRVRVNQSPTPGIAATVANAAQIGQLRSTLDDPTSSNVLPATAFWFPSADGYMSVLLGAVRTGGTGTLQVFCSLTEILDLVVYDLGDDPGDTGVLP